jgi:quercetin dioxygenase-like cupin family protein
MQSQITTDIGTELLFENERIRVWQMILQPGEESPHHFHEGDYVFIYTTPSRMTAFLEGQPPATADFDDGFVQYTEVGPGTSHHIRNDGTLPHRQILVEFKGPSLASTLTKPETNGRTHPST